MTEKKKSPKIGILALGVAMGVILAFGVPSLAADTSGQDVSAEVSAALIQAATSQEIPASEPATESPKAIIIDNGDEAGELGEEADDIAEEVSETKEATLLAAQVKLTEQQALEIAQQQYPGMTVLETDLGNENGVPVYEFEVQLADGSHIEVKVDANNGTQLPEDNDSEYED